MNRSSWQPIFLVVALAGSWTLGSSRPMVGQNQWAPGVPSTCPACKVGVGTINPSVALDVVGQGTGPLANFDNYGSTNPNFALRFARGTLLAPGAVEAGDFLGAFSGRGFVANGYGTDGFSAGRVRIDFVAAEDWTQVAQGAYLAFNTTPQGSTTIAERMRIDHNGNVGIGTLPTGNRLEVLGNANFSGTVTGGNIQAKYQDLAEWVPSGRRLEAGTVVILDAARQDGVVPSMTAYDTRVAGVVSTKPGVLLGEAAADKSMIATTGRVPVKVDATRSAIAVGDLLVTSDREGFAMKSEPLDFNGVPIHRPGTLIGKALEPLAQGQGDILVLLSLQ